jgi:membrane-bound lytic murein transglycosylase MltF
MTVLFLVAFLFLGAATPTLAGKKGKKARLSSTEATNDNGDETPLPIPKPWTGDFDEMKKARIIRMLVPYSKTFFFFDKAKKRGTAHDLGVEFQKWLNKKYKLRTRVIHVVFFPTSRDRLISGLVEGLGDIAAGNLTITPERSKRVDFADPGLQDVKELVVTGPSAPPLKTIEDLGGKEIHVRRSSSYYEHLIALNKKLKPKIKLKAADEDLEDEDLLEMVNAGLLPMVIVDDHKAKFWAQVFDKIKVREDLVVHAGGQVAWAVRKNSPLLLAEINSFLKTQGRQKGLINMVMRRYLRSTKYVKNATSEKEMEKFQKVIHLFKKYGKAYDFNHLMLLAQGYQESKLDQSAVSHRGAVGIMQLMPSTAENPPVSISGVDKDMEKNIEAGAKYLRWITDRYLNDPEITEMDRTLMAFAAYNAGPGNLRKFRRVAEKSGLDQNVWFGNVEMAAAKIIGRETVQYVDNIYKYYIAYSLAAKKGAVPAQ